MPTVQFSWRYWVLGAYKDRQSSAVHVYPFFCVRLTFGGIDEQSG